MDNIQAILKAAGSSTNDIVECICLLADFSEYAAFNSVYSRYFTGGNYPARAAFQVVALPKNARVEVKWTASKEW